MMKSWAQSVLLASTLAVSMMLFGCADEATQSLQAETQSEADQASIVRFFDRYARTWTDGLGDEYMSLLSDDIIAMVPGAPAVVGKEAVWKGMGPVFENNKMDLQIEVEEIRVADDWAFVRTALTFTGTPKTGEEAFHGVGKAVYLVERDPGGSWKIARDVYNWDHSLPASQ